MFQFSSWVNGEYSWDWNTNGSVCKGVIGTVSVASKERVCLTSTKQRLNVFQTSNLELFWIPINHLPLECMDQRVRVEEDRTIRKRDVTLFDRLKIFFGDWGLSNSPRTQIHDLVSILVNLTEQICHTWLGPVFACGSNQIIQAALVIKCCYLWRAECVPGHLTWWWCHQCQIWPTCPCVSTEICDTWLLRSPENNSW